MSPTIVMQDGAPLLVIGSPGGSRIIGYVVQGIVNYVDWGMNPQEAVSAPHLVNRFGTFDIEAGTSATELEAALQEAGFETNLRDLTSGLHAIAIEDGTLAGGADPRREGIALGE
jgi:gamma-glutamyltranspeptidase/glutathione hydrolase